MCPAQGDTGTRSILGFCLGPEHRAINVLSGSCGDAGDGYYAIKSGISARMG